MLFRGLEVGRPISPTQPYMETPVGAVVTSAEAGTSDTRHRLPVEHRVLPGGREWRRWSTDSATAELLVGPYSPLLPPEMMVHGCAVAVWRVRAHQGGIRPAFSCQWKVLPSGAEGGPNSGEGLDAQRWRIDRATLSMGTEDGEWLAARAKRGYLIPARLAPECDHSTVQYLDDGLQVRFPSLQANELVQAHFIVAWATLDDPYRSDTWFAVDQSPSEILTQLGVRGERS